MAFVKKNTIFATRNNMKFTSLTYILLAFLFVSCVHKTRQECILPKGVQLQAGDIVLRCGTGIESHAVRFADKSGVYSHIGIVVDSAGTMMIVHAVPGEPDFEGDEDRVKMERPEKFFSSMNARNGEVLRTSDKSAASVAAERAKSFYRRNIKFDHNYDDTDSTQLYCTELVLLSYKDVGAMFKNVEHHDVPAPGINCPVVFPSDIKKDKEFKSIYIF